MGQKSELFSVGSHRETGERHTRTAPAKVSRRRDLFEIAIVFALILIAVWMRLGDGQLLVSLVAMACLIGLALAVNFAASALGLTRPLIEAGRFWIAASLS